jgi:TrmH family RNA methyltransferase
MKTVSSRRNPLVARYRAAARGDSDGVVLLEGAHLMVEALDAGLRLREAAITPEAAARDEVEPILARLTRASTDVVLVAAGVMDALSPVKSPSGIVALADRPDTRAGRMYERASPLALIAVDVQDPGNVGAIVRVSEAGGAAGVIAGGACADPFGWKSIRGSMGSALRLPIAVERDAGAAIAAARRHGCRIMAAVPRGGQSMWQVDYAGPVAILIGGEGTGLPASLLAGADEHVTVPMQPPVESLNAAVTAALIVYEAFRQRSARTPSRSNAEAAKDAE